jgi:hypothetical protein
MQDVPKIVRQRLRAGGSAGNHPDANVLTAFVEKSLPDLERSGVMEHLSRCGECREVLALALPETESQAIAMPTRAGWFTWPVLRWGFVAAGIAVVASIGIVQYQRHAVQQSAMVAKKMSRPDAKVTSAETQPAVAPTAADAVEKQDKTPTTALVSPNAASSAISAEKKLVARAESAQPITHSQQIPGSAGGIARGAGAGAFSFGPHMPSQQQQQIQNQGSILASAAPTTSQQLISVDRSVGGAIQAAPPAPSSSETVAVEAQGAATEVQTQTSEVRNDVYALSKAKPAETVHAAPVWTISSAGVLQRSFDQGQSWQDVDVNTAPSASFAGIETTNAVIAKDTAKAMKVQAAPVFRAVSANGADVWAGGSNNALYHSVDTGSHWIRVLPASGGMTLTGDIVSVEFFDAQHGRITTSTSETWTTGDGGQAWQKQ